MSTIAIWPDVGPETQEAEERVARRAGRTLGGSTRGRGRLHGRHAPTPASACGCRGRGHRVPGLRAAEQGSRAGCRSAGGERNVILIAGCCRVRNPGAAGRADRGLPGPHLRTAGSQPDRHATSGSLRCPGRGRRHADRSRRPDAGPADGLPAHRLGAGQRGDVRQSERHCRSRPVDRGVANPARQHLPVSMGEPGLLRPALSGHGRRPGRRPVCLVGRGSEQRLLHELAHRAHRQQAAAGDHRRPRCLGTSRC